MARLKEREREREDEDLHRQENVDQKVASTACHEQGRRRREDDCHENQDTVERRLESKVSNVFVIFPS